MGFGSGQVATGRSTTAGGHSTMSRTSSTVPPAAPAVQPRATSRMPTPPTATTARARSMSRMPPEPVFRRRPSAPTPAATTTDNRTTVTFTTIPAARMVPRSEFDHSSDTPVDGPRDYSQRFDPPSPHFDSRESSRDRRQVLRIVASAREYFSINKDDNSIGYPNVFIRPVKRPLSDDSDTELVRRIDVKRPLILF